MTSKTAEIPLLFVEKLANNVLLASFPPQSVEFHSIFLSPPTRAKVSNKIINHALFS